MTTGWIQIVHSTNVILNLVTGILQLNQPFSPLKGGY